MSLSLLKSVSVSKFYEENCLLKGEKPLLCYCYLHSIFYGHVRSIHVAQSPDSSETNLAPLCRMPK